MERLIQRVKAAPDGQRHATLSKTASRIIGVAKSLGVDGIDERLRDAYYDSGGEDDRQIEGWVATAADAVPDDPESWIPLDERFWTARPEFQRIQQAAYAGGATPWAVLGAMAVRVLADVPPGWRLASGIGRRGGNLNLFVALAAESGGGKGVATDIAADMWPNDVYITEVASGESLPTLFKQRDKDGEVSLRDSAIVSAAEFSSLRASGDRSGSTLMARLCSAFSGERLSFTKADASRNVDVPDGSYRLGLITGIQMSNAKMLLSDDARATGLPQRFLWFGSVDPDFPEDQPEPPEPFVVPSWWRLETTKWIHVCDEAKADIRRGNLLRVRGTPDDALDGHKLYARLKFAYALAILNGRTDDINAEDWHLSGLAVDYSDSVREQALEVVARRTRRAAVEAGKARAEEQAVVEENLEERRLQRARDHVLRCLTGHARCPSTRGGVWDCAKGDIRDHVKNMITEWVESARLTEDKEGTLTITEG